MRSFVVSSLNLLQQYTPPLRRISTPVFRPDGASLVEANRPDWIMFVIQFSEMLLGTKEASAAVDTLAADRTLHPDAAQLVSHDTNEDHGDPTAPPRHLVLRFLWTYLVRIDDIKFSDQLFSSHFSGYWSIWHSESVEHEVFIPLSQFTCDLEQVVLTGNATIERFTQSMKYHLWQQHQLTSDLLREQRKVDFWKYAKSEFVIRIAYESKSPCEHNKEYVKIAEDFLLALRLLQPGRVYPVEYLDTVAIPMLTPRISPFRPTSWTRPLFDDESLDTIQRTTYVLQPSDIPTLQEVIQSLQRVSQSNIRILLDRFMRSYQRESDVDRLLDLFIGLDSCLLTGGGGGYKLALRGALLLNQQHAPQYTMGMFRAMQATRSSIVHSGIDTLSLPKEARKALAEIGVVQDDFLMKAQQLTRNVAVELLRHMQNGLSVAKVGEQLDKEIVRRLRVD